MMVTTGVSLLLLCDLLPLSSRAQAVDNHAYAPSQSAFNATTGNAVLGQHAQGSGAGGGTGNYLCEDWGAAWRTPCKIRSAEHLADGVSRWPPAKSRMC